MSISSIKKSLVVFLAATNSFGQDISVIGKICNPVLENGISDGYELLSDETRFNEIQNRLCSQRFARYDDMTSLTSTVGIPIPIAEGLLNLTGSLDAKKKSFQQNYSTFCDSQYSQSYYHRFTHERKTEVSRALLTSWNRCHELIGEVYLKQKGVIVSVHPVDGLRQFTVGLEVKVVSGSPKILQIAPAGLVSCESATGSTIELPFQLPLHEFTLTCRKDPNQGIPFSLTLDPGGVTKAINIPSHAEKAVELMRAIVALQNDLELEKKARRQLELELRRLEGEMPVGITIKSGPAQFHGPFGQEQNGHCPSGTVTDGIHLGTNARDIKINCAPIELVKRPTAKDSAAKKK